MKNINPQKIYQEAHETGLKAMVKGFKFESNNRY